MDARQVYGVLPDAWLSEVQVQFCPRCGAPSQQLRPNKPHGVCTKCGKMSFVNPSVGVTVLIESNGRVLLCRRSEYAGFGGLWCLPGGHIEYNEDFLSAGLREVEEETGLQVEITRLLSAVSTFWDHNASTLAIVLLASLAGGELRQDDHETTDVGWFDPDALPDLAFEADAHIIQRYFAAREDGVRVDAAYVRMDRRDAGYVPPPPTRYPERGKRW